MANATKQRLIDANALKNKAKMNGHCIRPLITGYHLCVSVHDIDEAPTVDAVEVVRCKDCLYCKANACIRKVNRGGPQSIDRVYANFFCAAGKRRAND